MVSTFTGNIHLEEPANGDYVGSWDVPVNANLTAIDLAAGQSQSVALGAGSVTLSTAQVRSASLILTGNIIANVAVTIPTISSGALVSGRYWNVLNTCGNSSAFYVTLNTTTGAIIGVPPFQPIGVFMEGTGSASPGSLYFKGFGPIGTYWDYAGSSVPSWIANSLIRPFLLCDGGTFSSAAYPALTVILGGNTLPDSRGRFRATLNQTTGRITSGSSTGGVDGNTNLAVGGAQTTTLSTTNVPAVDVAITDPGHTHTGTVPGSPGNQTTAGADTGKLQNTGTQALTINSAVTGITATAGNASPTNFSNLPPTYIGGLTFIRAG